MGSSASTPLKESSAMPSPATETPRPLSDNSTTFQNATGSLSTDSPTKKKKPNLSGPALVEYKCRNKKKAWKGCLADFYENRFLTAQANEQSGECDEYFEKFRECYMRGMLKERQKKSLEPPKAGTMLAEFMEEEGIPVGDSERKE